MENEIYPSTSIIIKGLYGGHRKGNVQISDNQEKNYIKNLKSHQKNLQGYLQIFI